MFDLPGPVLLAMETAMPVIEAERELRDGVEDSRLFDVVLQATGSERAAADAISERAMYRLKRHEIPDV